MEQSVSLHFECSLKLTQFYQDQVCDVLVRLSQRCGGILQFVVNLSTHTSKGDPSTFLDNIFETEEEKVLEAGGPFNEAMVLTVFLLVYIKQQNYRQ